jgi:hypothetical protein
MIPHVQGPHHSLPRREGRPRRQGVNFVNLRDAGDPVEAAVAYDAAAKSSEQGVR